MSDMKQGTTSSPGGQEENKLGSRAISGRPSKRPAFGSGDRFQPSTDTTYHSVVSIHANSVVVRKVKHLTQQPPPRHTRGIITRFSPRSRSRMMRKTGQIRHLKCPYFITLTYPGHFEHSPDRVKAHLQALKKRIKRRFPDMAMIWRMELKKRKTGASRGEIVPHFHILLWGMEILETDMHQAMVKLWFEVALSFEDHPPVEMPELEDMTKEEKDFALHGVKVEQLFNFRHTLAYVSKYAAKEEDDDSDEHWGRRWGVCGKIDLSPSVTMELTLKEHYALRRAIRKALEKRGSRYAWWLKQAYPQLGFSVLGMGDDDDARTSILSNIFRLVACTKGYDYGVRIIDSRRQS